MTTDSSGRSGRRDMQLDEAGQQVEDDFVSFREQCVTRTGNPGRLSG